MNNQKIVPTKKPKRWWIYILLIGLLAGSILVAWRFIYQDNNSTEQTQTTSLSPESNTTSTTQPEPEPQPEFNATALKSVLKKWGAGAGGLYGVTITDKNGKVLAEAGGEKQFFTASIYKLYVAYIGYQKIDDGTYSLDEPYLGGWTRGKCLDEMIRTSNSPCAEKLWNELGKEKLTAQLKTYGLENTSMTGLSTTSSDAAIVLARLERGATISSTSRKSMMQSMLKQIYQDTLQTGFVKADVYSKIGFNGTNEYHDTAIVHTDDGRSLIVSVLTNGVGTKKIAQLGRDIEAVL